MSIPQRVDGSLPDSANDSFKIQARPFEADSDGGGSLIILAALIYGVVLMVQGSGDESGSRKSSPALETSELENRQSDVEKDEPPAESDATAKQAKVQSQTDQTKSVTVQANAIENQESNSNIMGKSFFPRLTRLTGCIYRTSRG
ncbi:MAG: hypothetical protein R3C11_25595 [Planctomycetaceae bacterium]